MADRFLGVLGMLFVPAGVGVIAYADIFRTELLPIAGAVIGGTLVTFLATALVTTSSPRGAAAPCRREPAQAMRMPPMFLHDHLLWTTLSEQPILEVALTILAFLAALRIARPSGNNPLLNPALVSILIIAVGLPTGILSGIGFAWVLGASPRTLLSIAPKSVTTGIAVGISERIGGTSALTAILVIITGIVGAIAGSWLARLLHLQDDRVTGLTIGISAHGIGTARALQISEVAGAFSSLGMSLNGILTSVLFPVFLGIFAHT